MPVYKTTYRDIFDQFREENDDKVYGLGDNNFPEFCGLLFEATLKVFGIKRENLKHEDIVALKAKIQKLASSLKNKRNFVKRKNRFFSKTFEFEVKVTPKHEPKSTETEAKKEPMNSFEFEDVKPVIKQEPIEESDGKIEFKNMNPEFKIEREI